MDYSALKSFKKQDKKDSPKTYKRNVVYGDDLFALLATIKLKTSHGEENVLWCSDKKIFFDDLFWLSPGTLRGEENIDFFRENFFSDLPEVAAPSVFLKEGELREFGGRHKPEPFKPGEEFFVSPRVDFDVRHLFPEVTREEFTRLDESRYKATLSEIHNIQNSDLVEPANFELHFSNGEIIQCENLYFADGPAEFLRLFSDKNKLKDEMIEFSERLYKDKRTHFLAQSYTHQWGHFICEFDKTHELEEMNAQCFIDPEMSTDEEISKKIRLLGRVVEKICPSFGKKIEEEFITLSEKTPCSNICDSMFFKSFDKYENLKMISFNGVIENFANFKTSSNYPSHKISHITRAITCHKMI